MPRLQHGIFGEAWTPNQYNISKQYLQRVCIYFMNMVEHLPPIKGPSAADKVKDATRRMMDATKARLSSLKESFSKEEVGQEDEQGDIPVEHIEPESVDEDSEIPEDDEVAEVSDEVGENTESEIQKEDVPEIEESNSGDEDDDSEVEESDSGDEDDDSEIDELENEEQEPEDPKLAEFRILLSDAVDVMQYQSDKIKELQSSIEELEKPSEDNDSGKLVRPNSLGKDLNMTLNEGMTLIGISLLWLVALIGADRYVTNNGWMIGGVWPADLFSWGAGAGLWSFHILHRLHQARTLLSMPLGMRIQTSIGVALAAGTALMLTTEEFSTVTNIWAYGSIIALIVLFISGFGGAFSRAFSRKFGKGDDSTS